MVDESDKARWTEARNAEIETTRTNPTELQTMTHRKISAIIVIFILQKEEEEQKLQPHNLSKGDLRAIMWRLKSKDLTSKIPNLETSILTDC